MVGPRNPNAPISWKTSRSNFSWRCAWSTRGMSRSWQYARALSRTMRSSSESWSSRSSGSSHWKRGFMSLGFMVVDSLRNIDSSSVRIAAFPAPRGAMKKKTLTVEELWRIERPAQPTLSPDGAQACVSVTRYDMEKNKGQASLWLLSAFGGAPRRLTSAGEKDGEPQWSPDGRWIAFVAKRPAVGAEPADDEPQVYLIAPDGGEARRLTTMPTGAFGIKWFPDSRRLAFISWVWPDTKLGALAKRYKAHKERKVLAHVVEHSNYRYWDHWLSDGRSPHILTVDIATGRVRDLFEGSKYELVRGD